MKSVVIGLIIGAGCLYADVSCTNGNSVSQSGKTVSTSVGNILSGCLTVGGVTGSGNTTNDNVITDGLYVNPPTGAGIPDFQVGNLQVAWQVTESGGVYQYQYTFSDDNTAMSSNISHIDIGLGGSCTSATTGGPGGGSCIYNLTASNNNPVPGCDPCQLNSSPGNIGDELLNASGIQNGSNPDLPWSTEALQITTIPAHSITVAFDSNSAPVWENVYVRDRVETSDIPPGQTDTTVEAWNNQTSGIGFFIAAPAPEPAFYGLLALGMTGLFLARRISRKRFPQ